MSQDSKLYTTRSLILTAVIAIVGSVLVLEITGKIDHSDNKENLPIGEFTAIQVNPGESFNMSSKASELHARCETAIWPLPRISTLPISAFWWITRIVAC